MDYKKEDYYVMSMYSVNHKFAASNLLLVL
jgi:hypothetical protein